MVDPHAVFIEPDNPNQKIWRYMDFTKFVDLLNSEELYFTRPDKFEDPFEGSLTQATVRYILENFDGTPEQRAHVQHQLTNGIYKNASTYLYGVNCWHINEHESAGMWRLYLKSNEGIAIQTSYAKLKQALMPSPLTCYLGVVNYIDYDNDITGSDNLFIPLVHKRKHFEHENEVRAVAPIAYNLPQRGNPRTPDQLHPGIKVGVSLKELIERVYVSPNSPPWLSQLVRDTCQKFGFDFEVVNSRLSERPSY